MQWYFIISLYFLKLRKEASLLLQSWLLNLLPLQVIHDRFTLFLFLIPVRWNTSMLPGPCWCCMPRIFLIIVFRFRFVSSKALVFKQQTLTICTSQGLFTDHDIIEPVTVSLKCPPTLGVKRVPSTLFQIHPFPQTQFIIHLSQRLQYSPRLLL